ncbi:MAG: cytochrome c, partial [Nitrospirae bacterium]
GCFRCHGPGGLGGIANPGSFAGFIPGWRGRGYRALVRDREELFAWIREGTVARLEHNPVARWILSRQRIRMPAYRDRLSGEELEAIAAYVAWLQGR